MTHPNPAITETKFCVLAMRSPENGLSHGFTVVGPFDTEEEAGAWGCKHIADSDFDNPHWVVDTMTVPTEG